MTRSTGPFADEESKWVAVCERDSAADGVVYYSVATTGVYCRPSCPSRLPLRRNVVFHATPGQAERAGFRACKKCRPTEPSRKARDVELVVAACRRIEEAEAGPSLEQLAKDAGMSRYHFHRVFKAVTGITPKAYASAARSDRMKRELETSGSVTGAIYSAGFTSASRFYESSKKRLGMTASTFRRGGDGAEIRVAVGECSLGSILVAATTRGICSIQFGDDPDRLLRDTQEMFPKAVFIGGDQGFEKLVARVVAMVESPGRDPSLPLDVQGTAFQERVWRALQEIPLGDTATYSDIARRIGTPAAVRAVARACASNRIAVAIPCHRVVRSDGSNGGYRWGVERKRELLNREAAK